jgi:glucose/arabinose dehydrogenase
MPSLASAGASNGEVNMIRSNPIRVGACQALACAAFVSYALPARAVVDDPNFTETEVLDTSEPYSGLAWAPDGSDRLFLIKKEGTVQIFERGVLSEVPFAFVRPLYGASECGLIGIAFDPNFGENQFVYFFATVSSSEQQIIRYRAVGNIGVEPTPIVTGLPTNGRNHDGGAIGFGPDGKLYWAIGDLGAGVGVGDDLTSMAAKVGRANRDGTLVTDNPFDDGTGPQDERIWARGFRNPFTMTFQPSTGELWLNVVGTSWEQIFVVGRGDHGGWTPYESIRPDEFINPKISYNTNAFDTYPLAAGGAVRAAGVATFTTAIPHWLREGERVTVAGVADTSFNGMGYVSAVLSETTFALTQAGPDASSGGGTVTTFALGGCVTGGTFYDSTAATDEYRGNFFFGDFNSGLIMRARVSGTRVFSVEPFASGHRDTVDMGVGPDGDLYHVSHGGPGGLWRERFQAISQGIVVSKSNVWMLEGGVAAFNIRLSMAPTEDVNVVVRRASGDADVSVTDGTSLMFTPDDWLTPQVVRLAARQDPDAADDVAELMVTSEGLPTERVAVRVTDELEFDPPGQGGEGGMTGEAGAAGDGTGDGGRALGGSAGTSGGRGGAGGSAGTDGAAGEDAPGGTGPKSDSDGGCGCALERRSGSSAGALLVLAWLLRRRLRRRAP